MQITRRPTWPDHMRETDWVVLYEGQTIARVAQREHGPSAGLWGWSCLWYIEQRLSGTSDTLQAALEEVKKLVPDDVLDLLHPGGSKRP